MLTGGSNNDVLRGGSQGDSLAGSDGNDSLDAGARQTGGAGDLVDGGLGNDTLVVNAGSETLGVQLYAGGAPSFLVRSTSGNFVVDAYNVERINFTGGAGSDDVTGSTDADLISGAAGADVLSGAGAGDTIAGGLGNDTLNGNDGIDVLDGGKDNDVLRGGKHADTLTGALGADVFDYDLKTDSAASTPDTITDFAIGQDDVNLADLDANSNVGGHQLFAFIGTAAFTGVAGQLRSVAGLVEADLNGDASADFRIIIGNGATLGAGDFILV